MPPPTHVDTTQRSAPPARRSAHPIPVPTRTVRRGAVSGSSVDSPVVNQRLTKAKAPCANGSASRDSIHTARATVRLTKHTLKPYTVHTPIHIIIDSAVYHRDHAAPQTANKQQGTTSATHAHSAAVLACPSCVRFALNCAHTTCKCASLPVFYPVRVSTAHSPVITLPMTRCPSNASARL